MKLFTYAIARFACLYSLCRICIHEILTEYQPSQKQIDDFANKLDIIGGAAVAQSVLSSFDTAWLNHLMVVLSVIFCGIIWTVTFIMKGYKNDCRY